jgi:antitoxin component of MazEF toxin-antitoxin module
MIVIPVVRVGNSRGLRIPKKILDAIGAPTQVQLDVQDGLLIIRPITAPRLGWNDPARWQDNALTDEDADWLNAPLAPLTDSADDT